MNGIRCICIRWLLLILIVLSPFLSIGGKKNVIGQNPFYFKKITVKDGLSHSTVGCFLEDQLGFMWIGTYNGLNKYDGVSFKSYSQEDGVSNNNILDLAQSSDGIIWIGTGVGITAYDPAQEKFSSYVDSSSHNFFSDILVDEPNKRVWICADEGGLKYFDINSSQINQFDNAALNSAKVRSFLQISDEEILIGTHRAGVFKLNINSQTVNPYLNDTTSQFKLPGLKVWQMVMDGDDLFIGIEGIGVCIYDTKSFESTIINQENSDLGNNNVAVFGFDYKNNLLVGTDGGGFSYYNRKTKNIYTYQKQEADLRSISSNAVRAIFTDSEENIWIGTYNGGVNFINKFNQNIHYFGKNILDKNSLSSNEVTSFIEAKDGGMWIGTDKGGLNHLKNGRFNVITEGDSPNQLNDYTVITLAYDKEDNLLVGTYTGGLNIFKKDQIIKHVYDFNNPKSISDNWVWDIEVDKSGDYWLAVINGLNKFDPQTKEFTSYTADLHDSLKFLPANNLSCLLIDSKQNLWVGTFGGLGKFNLAKEEFECFIHKEQNSGLKHNTIVTIFEDSKSRIWVGSLGGGLALLDQNNMTLTPYGVQDGLPSDVIQSIEEDDHGNLWISTIRGIAKFNPESVVFQVMDENYGLQSNIFVHNSSLKDKNGFMYFGGVNGFNVFHPDSIHFPDITNPVVLSDFQLFNKSIHVGDDSKLINKSIAYTDRISINYEESRFFTVHFTLPNFSVPNKLSFAYMLEGFNDDWVYIGGERKVTFTNLSPGEYTLRLKQSSNNDWNDDHTSLKLTIIPPFYMRNEFLGFLFLVFIGSVIGLFKYRTRSLERRKLELEKIVEKQNEEITKQNKEITKQNSELVDQNFELVNTHKKLEDVNKSLEGKIEQRTAKLRETVDQLNKTVTELDRFVYSASHDLSAPLKSIQGLVNIARIENRGHDVEVHLDYIEKSIEKLEGVIKDLIQFSRNSRSELEYKEIDLEALLKGIVNSLKYISAKESLKIELDFHENCMVFSDRQRLQMIFENLIVNAIKYQDAKKDERWVKISCQMGEKQWSVQISDNGEGIPKNQQEKVFQMFYRASELSDGTGLGLYIVKEAINKLGGEIRMDSVPNEGTTFIVIFSK